MWGSEGDRKNNTITIGSFNIHDLPEKRRNKQKRNEKWNSEQKIRHNNNRMDAENKMNRLIMPSAQCSVCCFRESTPFLIPLHASLYSQWNIFGSFFSFSI